MGNLRIGPYFAFLSKFWVVEHVITRSRTASGYVDGADDLLRSGLGLIEFGGPVALVGQMEGELVTERRWLSKEQMREAIAVCQSLPGPLAMSRTCVPDFWVRGPADGLLSYRIS
jgi:Chromate transporter